MPNLVLLEDDEIDFLAASALMDLEATYGDDDKDVIARNDAARRFLAKIDPGKIAGWEHPELAAAMAAGKQANEELEATLVSAEDALSQGQENVAGTDVLADDDGDSMWAPALRKVRALMARVGVVPFSKRPKGVPS